jgi:hypothetical protein
MLINEVDDYELSYNLFLAEQELFNDMTRLEYCVVSESTTLELLQEGVKETIMNYLRKIMTQIQKIWSKFKSGVTSKVANYLSSKVEPLFKVANDTDFIVKNYVEYDMNKLNNYNIAVFDYSDQTKEKYKSEAEYIKRTYPDLDVNIKKSLLEKVTSTTDSFRITKEILIKDIYGYCKAGYKKDIEDISEDIDHLNNSSKNITAMVNSVSTAQETVNMWLNLSLGVVTEAEEDNKKMSFEDNYGEKSGDNAKADKAKGEITTAVTVYMSSNTKLLSAKMYVVNKKFSTCMKILKHFVVFYNKNKSAVEKKKAVPTVAPTVDTK